MKLSREEDKESDPDSETSEVKRSRGEKKIRPWPKRFAITLAVFVLLYFSGPRISVSHIERREVSGIANELSELDDYLKKSEEQFSDIVPGTEKMIRWYPGYEGKQTAYSVVYLHGFSGSHPTLAPAMDRVAEGLEAHLFCTRFAGHGRKDADGFGGPLGEATLQDWVDDTVEALAIGRKLGKRVVVIANSTAAPIVSWLASQGDRPHFFIMWSPNFGVKDWKGEFLLGPWGKQLLAFSPGDTYECKPANIYGEEHKRLSTTIYPDKAILSMMAAVKLGRESDLEKVSCPTLCLYSRKDEVVSPDHIETYFKRLGNPRNKLLEIKGVTHREFHVLAGDLMSPDSTHEVVMATLNFIGRETPNGE